LKKQLKKKYGKGSKKYNKKMAKEHRRKEKNQENKGKGEIDKEKAQTHAEKAQKHGKKALKLETTGKKDVDAKKKKHVEKHLEKAKESNNDHKELNKKAKKQLDSKDVAEIKLSQEQEDKSIKLKQNIKSNKATKKNADVIRINMKGDVSGDQKLKAKADLTSNEIVTLFNKLLALLEEAVKNAGKKVDSDKNGIGGIKKAENDKNGITKTTSKNKPNYFTRKAPSFFFR